MQQEHSAVVHRERTENRTRFSRCASYCFRRGGGTAVVGSRKRQHSYQLPTTAPAEVRRDRTDSRSRLQTSTIVSSTYLSELSSSTSREWLALFYAPSRSPTILYFSSSEFLKSFLQLISGPVGERCRVRRLRRRPSPAASLLSLVALYSLSDEYFVRCERLGNRVGVSRRETWVLKV